MHRDWSCFGGCGVVEVAVRANVKVFCAWQTAAEARCSTHCGFDRSIAPATSYVGTTRQQEPERTPMRLAILTLGGPRRPRHLLAIIVFGKEDPPRARDGHAKRVTLRARRNEAARGSSRHKPAARNRIAPICHPPGNASIGRRQVLLAK